MRLVKFLALAGLASRRKAVDLVKQGKVKIKRRLGFETLSYQVDPERDQVLVEGKEVKLSPKVYLFYFILQTKRLPNPPSTTPSS
jgi:23S rRNA pseudouridine2605 synthase